MQQLVIKLSPEATAAYLKVAAAKQPIQANLETSGVHLGINMSMISGLQFADIDVNGQRITSATDDEDLEFELVNLN